jgi:hypothetical protein
MNEHSSEHMEHLEVGSGDVLVAVGTATNKCIFWTRCAEVTQRTGYLD